jgi:hypothetical protein
MLTRTPRLWVRKTGKTGYSISVEMSANRLARASKKVFVERPEKYLLIGATPAHCPDGLGKKSIIFPSGASGTRGRRYGFSDAWWQA